MVGASKILTVSYGTFSCTLEGFDDPFNTMKAIAEYFRDLAAEDRYFGAEPPTPDAAMLHRIAEREVQRRVEAKVQDNGVILRAQPDEVPSARVADTVPAVVVAAPVFEPAVAETAPYEDAPYEDVAEAASEPFVETVFDLPEADEPFTAVEDTVYDSPVEFAQPVQSPFLPTVSDMPEGVAARLAKIRAAVALTESAPKPADYAEDQHADESFAAFESLEDTVVPSVADVSFSAEDDADDIADLAALDGVELAELDAKAADVAEAAQDEALSDIFADQAFEDEAETNLVTSTEPAFEEDEAYLAPVVAEPADEPAALAEPEPLPEPDISDDDVLANLTAAFAGEQPSASVNADTIVFNDEDDLLLPALLDEDMLSEVAVEQAAVEDLIDAEISLAAEAEEAGAEEAGAEEADAEEPVSVYVDNEPFSFAQDDLASEAEMEAESEAAAEAQPEADTEEPNHDPAPELAAAVVAPAEPDASEKLQRARARIIRVRRAPDIAIAPKAEPAAPVLSDEAEAELQRELAALEDATSDAATFEDAAETAEQSVEDADDDLRRQLSALGADQPAPAAAAGTLDPAVQDESLRRLMDQTQSEMAEPGNRRRLSSIAHLKAAVAATIAERFGNKPKPVEEVEAVRAEPYRNDLARAVRPVRPAAGSTAERPSPLVLVSEQRIDRPAAPAAVTTVTPVRPRRISAQAVAVQPAYDDEDFDIADDDTDNIFGDSKGFTEFADRIGATDLSELLEAAAAYSSAVEGRAHFTRPQLLRQISAVTGSDVSREDELRGFGALLRDGRIVKVKRGQFALTDQSTYLNEARKISG